MKTMNYRRPDPVPTLSRVRGEAYDAWVWTAQYRPNFLASLEDPVTYFILLGESICQEMELRANQARPHGTREDHGTIFEQVYPEVFQDLVCQEPETTEPVWRPEDEEVVEERLSLDSMTWWWEMIEEEPTLEAVGGRVADLPRWQVAQLLNFRWPDVSGLDE